MWGMQFLGLFPQMVLVPYLVNRIGEGGYGIYALAWSLLASIDQLEKSLQSGIVKYCAGFIAQQRMDEVNKILSTSFIFSLFIGAVFCAVILVVAVSYKTDNEALSVSLIIIGIMLLLIIPVTPFIGIAQSKQRYYIGGIADTTSKYASLIAIVVWFAIFGASVETLIIIMAVTLFISRISQVPITYKLVPGLKNHIGLFDKKSLKMIGAFGAATVIASLCLAFNSTGVRWLMSELVSTTFVTHLVIILMPTLLLSQIIGAMTVTAMPAASAYAILGRQNALRELLTRGARYTMMLSLGVLLSAMVAMTDVLRLWVGQNYEFLAPYALLLLSGCALMQSTSVAHHMLKGMGRVNIVVFVYFVGLVVVPFALIVSMLYMQMNPYIAVSAGLSAGYIVTGFLQIYFCGKAVNAHFGALFIQSYVKPIAAASALFLVNIFLNLITETSGAFWSVSIATSIAVAYYAVCYFLIASSQEREEINDLVQLLVKKLGELIRR